MIFTDHGRVFLAVLILAFFALPFMGCPVNTEGETPAEGEGEANSEGEDFTQDELRDADIVMSIPDRSALGGGEVFIPLNVESPSSFSPAGMDIWVEYDPNVLDASTVQVQPTGLTGHLSFLGNVEEPGRVTISVVGESNAAIKGQGHLFDIYARLKDDVPLGECGTLRYSRVRLFNADIESIPVNYVDDTGDACVSPDCLFGDANGDAEVNSGDVLHALSVAVERRNLTDCSLRAADLNGDNRIDSADAVMIQRLAARLPINPNPITAKQGADPRLLQVLLAEKESVQVAAADVEGAVGGRVEVAITADDITGLSGFDIALDYPSAFLRFESAQAGEDVSGLANFEYHETTSLLRLSLGRQEALGDGRKAIQPGTLATLEFTVLGAPGDGAAEITLEEVRLKGQYGDSYDWYTRISRVNGEVFITGGGGGSEGEAPGPQEGEDEGEEAPPLVSAQPNVIDFGSLLSGTQSSSFEVRNVGGGVLRWGLKVTAGGEAAPLPGWLSLSLQKQAGAKQGDAYLFSGTGPATFDVAVDAAAMIEGINRVTLGVEQLDGDGEFAGTAVFVQVVAERVAVPVADLSAALTGDADGGLSLEEAQAAAPGLTQNTFDVLDREGDGVLNQADLFVHAASLDFAGADTDQDGALSLGEAQAILAGLDGATFDMLDVNGDGFLLPGELGGPAVPNEGEGEGEEGELPEGEEEEGEPFFEGEPEGEGEGYDALLDFSNAQPLLSNGSGNTSVAPGGSAWYYFDTFDCAGALFVDALGSRFDTRIDVYRESGSDLILLDSNDDCPACEGTLDSCLSVSLFPNTRYYVVVYGCCGGFWEVGEYFIYSEYQCGAQPNTDYFAEFCLVEGEYEGEYSLEGELVLEGEFPLKGDSLP